MSAPHQWLPTRWEPGTGAPRSSFDPGQGRTGFGRRLFLLRFARLGLNQQAFADRFGLTKGAVKDLEQNRTSPSKAMRVLVAAIELDPALVARAAASEAHEALTKTNLPAGRSEPHETQ